MISRRKFFALLGAAPVAASLPTEAKSAWIKLPVRPYIKFSGTLTGNRVITLTLPRRYRFDNQVASETPYIQIVPV